MIRVLLAHDDDHRGAEVRARLAGPAMIVVGALPFDHELAAAARKLTPDVIVADTGLAVGQVLPVAADVRTRLPSCAILVLCDPARPGMLPPRRRGSHVSFLPRDATPARLADSVRRLAAGERIVPARLWLAALNTPCDLKVRELEVLGLAAEGDSVDDIARRLNLAGGTVRNYLSSVIAKTGARNRIDAIRIVRANGWLR